MPDIYKKILDLYEAYTTLRVKDLAVPTFAGLWILTLLIPLTGINKRDLATALSYIVYIVASAVVLLFILPSQYIDLDITLASQLTTLVAIATAGGMRWWFREDLAHHKDDLFTGPISEEVSE